jgi:hypothetical protein
MTVDSMMTVHYPQRQHHRVGIASSIPVSADRRCGDSYDGFSQLCRRGRSAFCAHTDIVVIKFDHHVPLIGCLGQAKRLRKLNV